MTNCTTSSCSNVRRCCGRSSRSSCCVVMSVCCMYVERVLVLIFIYHIKIVQRSVSYHIKASLSIHTARLIMITVHVAKGSRLISQHVCMLLMSYVLWKNVLIMIFQTKQSNCHVTHARVCHSSAIIHEVKRLLALWLSRGLSRILFDSRRDSQESEPWKSMCDYFKHSHTEWRRR